jgi:hypothetical protein
MVHHPGIHHPVADLDTGLWSSAHWIWDRRRIAKAIGFPFGEETVTETVLLDLAATLPGIVHIVPFTKPEEGKTGADWEWCLHDVGRSRYLRFLVQAKVLDDRDGEYAHLDRFIGESKIRQIDRLRATSAFRRIPALYVFYNHVANAARVPTGQCLCQPCMECWGASVASLNAIHPIIMGAPRDKSFDTLSQVSVAWRCLLCAADGRGPIHDPIDGAIAGLQRLADISGERFADVPPVPDVPERDPPSYLGFLLDRAAGVAANPIDDRLREKLAGENPGVDGVILVDAGRSSDEFFPRLG